MKRLTHQLKSSCADVGMHSINMIYIALEQQPLDDFSLREEIQQSLYEVERWLEGEKPSHV